MTVISLLTLCAFLLPAESGERISLAITLLLSMTVFMMVVADMIPATSESVPLVGVFFNTAMVQMVVMIVALCYTLRLYHKDADDPQMSPWTRRVILDWLSYKVGVRQSKHAEEKKLPNSNNYLIKKRSSDTNDVNDYHGDGRYHSDSRKDINDNNAKDTTVRWHNGGAMSETAILHRKVDALMSKAKVEADENIVRNEWTVVARTIDRCLFILFVVVFFITILAWSSLSPGYVQ